MKHPVRFALVSAAAIAVASSAALAQMAPPPPAPDMYGAGPMHGRLAERALRDFDLNHDGKIAKAELDKALALRFKQASGGAATLTPAQFARSHADFLNRHAIDQFKKVDWNGDGKLSLEEFRAPLRARFEKMDRDGSGTLACTAKGAHRGRGHGRGAGSSLMRMCQEADLNHDGKLTRGEFDAAVAKKYAAIVQGGPGMSAQQFHALELARFNDMELRRFKRLDKNKDGKLSEAEFAAPAQKLFARLDKNHDGVLAPDELSRPHRGSHHGPRHGRGGPDKGPR